MKTTTVAKDKLVGHVTRNLEEHLKALRGMVADYGAGKAKALKEFYRRVEGGRDPERAFARTFGRLNKPESHEAEYRAALSQLEWEEGGMIELSEVEFHNLVADEWSWRKRFDHIGLTNTEYLK